MITINGDPINITRFPDGTTQVWKIPNLYGDVVWTFENEAEVMHLAQLAVLLRKSRLPRHLVITYLPYARQDKEVLNDQTFALRAFAPLLNAMKWDTIKIYDPHSEVAIRLLHKAEPIYFGHEVMLVMKQLDADQICFPDAGALAKYKSLFWGVPYIHAEKTRDPATGRVETLPLEDGVVGTVLIVDDICDGGATFIGLAKALHEAGASEVYLFVSHGLFTKGVKVLLDAGISRVFTPKGEVLP